MTTRVPRPSLTPVIALSVLLSQVVITTQVDNARPAFAEASVKAIDASILHHTGRQLTLTTFVDRSNLLQLIVSAYLDGDAAGACARKVAYLHDCEPIVGSAPEWVSTDKFEVIAKLPSDSLLVDTLDGQGEFRFRASPRKNVYPLPVQLMLQRLLEETFDLKVRRERREVSVWAIKTRTKESTLMPSNAALSGMHTDGLALGTRRRTDPSRWLPDDPVQLVFEGSTMKDAADFFSFYLDRPVIDRTGLEGEYNFTLEFRGDSRVPYKRGGVPVMGGFDVARLASALAAHGFALESTTASFEVLVIENVRKPFSN